MQASVAILERWADLHYQYELVLGNFHLSENETSVANDAVEAVGGSLG